MKSKYKILLVLACIAFLQQLQSAVVYVKKGATGSNNGSSWTNAYTDLSTALTNAPSGSDLYLSNDTFYLPNGSARGIGFLISSKSLNIYGGFPNTGNPGMAQRNIALYKTIVSGDNSKNDVEIGSGITADHSSRTDNAYHVFIISFGSGTYKVRLDGITISGGNANSTNQNSYGAGIYYSRTANGTGSQEQEVSVYNCTFENNSAKQAACFFTSFGYVKCDYVRFNFVSCQIKNNYADDYVIGNFNAPANSNVDLSYSLWNNLIHNNYMATNATAMFYSGGAENSASASNFAFNIHFNTFAKNTMNSFGVLLVEGNKLTSFNNAANISNNIFYSNGGKPAMVSRLGKSKFKTYTIDNNICETNDSFLMKYDGGNNKIISTSPFQNISDNNFNLTDCSPFVNSGSLNIYSPNKTDYLTLNMPVTVDALQKNRQNNGYYDIGAVEYSGNKFPAKTSVSNVICFGETYSFNGKTITQSGIYYDTFTAKSGCDSFVINEVTVNDSLQARIGVQYDNTTMKWYVGCQRAGLYSFNSYQWYINDTLVPGANLYYIERSKYGKYYCKVTFSQNGKTCNSQSPDYVYQNPAQLGSRQVVKNIVSVLPNPTNDKIQWTGPESGAARLYNSAGKIVMQSKDKSNTMNLSTLPNGVYILRFENTNTGIRIVKE